MFHFCWFLDRLQSWVLGQASEASQETGESTKEATPEKALPEKVPTGTQRPDVTIFEGHIGKHLDLFLQWHEIASIIRENGLHSL